MSNPLPALPINGSTRREAFKQMVAGAAGVAAGVTLTTVKPADAAYVAEKTISIGSYKVQGEPMPSLQEISDRTPMTLHGRIVALEAQNAGLKEHSLTLTRALFSVLDFEVLKTMFPEYLQADIQCQKNLLVRIPLAFQYIKEPTEEVCVFAVAQNAPNIRYIKNPSVAAQLAAIEGHWSNIMHIENPADEVIDTALKYNIEAFRHIKNPSPELVQQVFAKNHNLIIYISEPTDEMCEIALNENTPYISHCKALQNYIDKASEEQQLKWFAKNQKVFNYAAKTEKLQLAALAINPEYIRNFRDTQFPSVRQMIADKYPLYIGHVMSWTTEECLELVKKSPENILKIQFGHYTKEMVQHVLGVKPALMASIPWSYIKWAT